MKIKTKNLFNSKTFNLIFSVVAAIIVWSIVTTVVDSQTTQRIRNVPLTIDTNSGVLAQLGLSTVGDVPEEVSVVVSGSRYVVGNINAQEDIQVTANLSQVTGPGTYELTLNATDVNGKGFTVDSISPRRITVTFDRMQSKSVPITANISSMNIPSGYIREKEVVSPEEVLITGPATEVNQVASAVVEVRVSSGELTSTQVVEEDIILLDSNGNELQKGNMTLSVETASVTIPVLKTKEVSFTFDYLNAPPDFDESMLSYSISESSINIAGPEESIDSYEAVDLGHIDLRELAQSGGTITKEISLPSGYVNLDDFDTVTITFQLEGYTTQSFNITNLTLRNVPSDCQAEIVTSRISNVQIFGPQEVLDQLTGSDFVAEVDLSGREVDSGQSSIPVTIYAPGRGNVWAVESDSVIISVQRQ